MENMIQDRIGEYLIPHMDNYLFDELSDNYLKKAGIEDILKGVPIPIDKKELSGLTTLSIAKNMAFVIGCDVNFQYRDNYIAYIERTFTKDFVKPLINEGIEGAAKNDFDYACVLFRAALLIDPENADALYCYGRACKDSYEVGEGEEYIGRYKAESLEAFEKLTIKKPDFDMGFYFLGYAYLNMGLYVKAKLTWDTFMELSNNKEQMDEVSEWLVKLAEPVKIEEGYNHILAGRYEDGIKILSAYVDDERYNTWWPLWYYLGVANMELGLAKVEGTDEPGAIIDMERVAAAEQYYQQVLKLSPSNIETMNELVEIYKAVGDTAKVEKYQGKIQVVKRNMELDQAAKQEGLS